MGLKGETTMQTEQKQARIELLAALAAVIKSGNRDAYENIAVACQEYLEAEEEQEKADDPLRGGNGARVIQRTETCVFVRLPESMQRPIDLCSCSYCKSHPNETPRWDTLAVGLKRPETGADYAWTVHMPVPGVL